MPHNALRLQSDFALAPAFVAPVLDHGDAWRPLGLCRAQSELRPQKFWLASAVLHVSCILFLLYSAFAYRPAELVSADAVAMPVVFVAPSDDPVPSPVEQVQQKSTPDVPQSSPVKKQQIDRSKFAAKSIQPAAEDSVLPPMAAAESVMESSPAPTEIRKTDVTENSIPVRAAAGEFRGLPLMQSPDFLQNPASPVYPAKSVANNEQGTVIVRARVNPDGTPDEILIWESSGYSLLDRAAIQAVQQWRFRPARSGFRTVASWVEVPVDFVLR